MCIEYDGVQHFKPIEYFGGLDNLKYVQKHDKIKTKYCYDNNIILLRIKYSENVIKKFKGNVQEFVSWANSSNSTSFATLAPLVIEALKDEDPIAINLVTKAAHFINRLIYDLDKKAGTKERNLPLCMMGGISPYIVPYMDPLLKSRIIEPQYGPAKGAILFLKKDLKLKNTT